MPLTDKQGIQLCHLITNYLSIYSDNDVLNWRGILLTPKLRQTTCFVLLVNNAVGSTIDKKALKLQANTFLVPVVG